MTCGRGLTSQPTNRNIRDPRRGVHWGWSPTGRPRTNRPPPRALAHPNGCGPVQCSAGPDDRCALCRRRIGIRHEERITAYRSSASGLQPSMHATLLAASATLRPWVSTRRTQTGAAVSSSKAAHWLRVMCDSRTLPISRWMWRLVTVSVLARSPVGRDRRGRHRRGDQGHPRPRFPPTTAARQRGRAERVPARASRPTRGEPVPARGRGDLRQALQADHAGQEGTLPSDCFATSTSSRWPRRSTNCKPRSTRSTASTTPSALIRGCQASRP